MVLHRVPTVRTRGGVPAERPCCEGEGGEGVVSCGKNWGRFPCQTRAMRHTVSPRETLLRSLSRGGCFGRTCRNTYGSPQLGRYSFGFYSHQDYIGPSDIAPAVIDQIVCSYSLWESPPLRANAHATLSPARTQAWASCVSRTMSPACSSSPCTLSAPKTISRPFTTPARTTLRICVRGSFCRT